jgi:hypothetical protein
MTEQITTEAKLARAEQYGVLERIPLHNRGGPKGMLCRAPGWAAR